MVDLYIERVLLLVQVYQSVLKVIVTSIEVVSGILEDIIWLTPLCHWLEKIDGRLVRECAIGVLWWPVFSMLIIAPVGFGILSNRWIVRRWFQRDISLCWTFENASQYSSVRTIRKKKNCFWLIFGRNNLVAFRIGSHYCKRLPWCFVCKVTKLHVPLSLRVDF